MQVKAALQPLGNMASQLSHRGDKPPSSMGMLGMLGGLLGSSQQRSSQREYHIFFSLRLAEAMDEAEELKAAIQRARPVVSCFLSGGNPNASDLGIIIPRALNGAKLAIVMGSKTYGKQTASNFSTYEEMQFILSEKKPMFLLKMCDDWEEAQTKVMIGSKKYKPWQVGTPMPNGIVDEILAIYDQAGR